MLVVEDVVTTGGSTQETIDVARAAGAPVVGAAAIIDRSGGKQRIDVPFHALATVALPTYEAGAVSAVRGGKAGRQARIPDITTNLTMIAKHTKRQ